jgi:hypothetical protein
MLLAAQRAPSEEQRSCKSVKMGVTVTDGLLCAQIEGYNVPTGGT